MANHQSALKRARQTVKRTAVNRAAKSRLRTSLRKFRQALAAGDQKAASASFGETASIIDKTAKTGVIHRNTAARYKSRLSARLNKLSAK
jgi:small subunit ribosomal protein S20